MGKSSRNRISRRELIAQLAFFAPKFWFPALIAASVFPSVIAYSGPIFSTIALWIVALVLLAGLVVTLASTYAMRQTMDLHSTATLVESQLGHIPAALTAAASILGLVMAVAALISTGTSFLVVSLDLPESWRIWLVLIGFLGLFAVMMNPVPFRQAMPWFTLLIFVVALGVLTYGYVQYFSNPLAPRLLELLSGSARAKDAVTSDYLSSGWQAVAVALLLLVPLTPSITIFRNEKSKLLSGFSFRLLAGSAAAFFALTVYLSFIVVGFNWTRLDTIIQGPSNLVLLLERLLGTHSLIVVFVMVIFALGCFIAAYIFLSGASTLLDELGVHHLMVRQVPVPWYRRGRSAVVLSFLAVTAVVALFIHDRMDLVSLTWVLFVAIASFIGQVARLKLWRERLARGDTYVQRRQAKHYVLIGIINVAISLTILLVVSLAFSYTSELLVLAAWLILSVAIAYLNYYYRRNEEKMSDIVTTDDSPVKRCTAVTVVPGFDAVALQTVRYAWTAHHPHVEVLLVARNSSVEKQARSEWEALNIPAALTLVRPGDGDYPQAVVDYVKTKLAGDPETIVAVYLPRFATRKFWPSFFYNATEQAYARRLNRLSRVTVTWVGLDS